MSRTIDHRYEILGQIGQGSMGEVFQARDRLTGGDVALKTVRMQGSIPHGETQRITGEQSELRLALAREFETLASLRHPNIISVLSYGFDFTPELPAPLPYFTMEYVPQTEDFLSWALARPEPERLHLVLQVLAALAYLHRRGLLHRDLKPSNILIRAGQACLADFGLTMTHGEEKPAAGTLAYMAPEVLRGQPPGPPADLYAAGILAFQLLTGVHPFGGGNPANLIQATLEGKPALEILPPAWQATFERLLAREPAHRFQDAEAASAALREAAGLPAAPEAHALRESYLQAARLVGRARELAQLEAHLETTLQGHGGAVLISGESGVGKSRLLSELRARALIRGAAVVRGGAIAEAAAPYQLWQRPLRTLALTQPLSDTDALALLPALPDLPALLGRPLPAAPALPPSEARANLALRFVELIRAQPRPYLLLLEDLHWAGEDDLALLQSLCQGLESLPLLVVATARSDERPDLVETLPQFDPLPLARLEEKSIRELCGFMLGPAAHSNTELLTRLQRETEGNVFFLIEYLRVLADEAGGLARVASQPLPAAWEAGGVRAILARRLARVPADLQTLLEDAAMLGRELNLAVLAALHPGVNLVTAAATAASLAVLEPVGPGWRFTHDRLREELVAAIPTAHRAPRHRQIALTLETLDPAGEAHAPALAHHWGAASQPDKEAQYLLLAGRQARARFAIQDAIGWLERAAAVAPTATARLEAAIELNAVLDMAGDDARAMQHARAALDFALAENQPVELLRCRLGLANCYWRAGDYPPARQQAEAALEIAEELGDENLLAETLKMLGIIADDSGNRSQALESLGRALEIVQRTGNHKLEALLCGALGNAHLFSADATNALPYYERDLVLSRSLQDIVGEAGALGNIGSVHYTLGKYALALDYYRQEYEQASRSGFTRGLSVSIGNMGVIYMEQGHYPEARACTREYIRLCLRHHFAVNLGIALFNLAEIEVAQGQYASAATRINEVIAAMGAKLSPYYIAGGYLYLGRAQEALGQTEAARVSYQKADEEAERSDTLDYRFQAALALARLTPANPAAALQALQADWPEPGQQAAILYELWRCSPADEAIRHAALVATQATLAETSNATLRQRVAELGGPPPPEPELPPLPEAVAAAVDDMDLLLAQARQRLNL